jgi:predicted RNA methylase
MIFFNPDTDMVDWLVKYINNRLVIDVGAGEELHLSQLLLARGVTKLVSIDPDLDIMTIALLKNKMNTNVSFHVLPGDIQKHKSMIMNHPKFNTLIIFARPCHSDFVEYTLENMKPGMEALYITLPENIDRYDDLGEFKNKMVKLEHKGTSSENEVVYSIKF